MKLILSQVISRSVVGIKIYLKKVSDDISKNHPYKKSHQIEERVVVHLGSLSRGGVKASHTESVTSSRKFSKLIFVLWLVLVMEVKVKVRNVGAEISIDKRRRQRFRWRDGMERDIRYLRLEEENTQDRNY